MNNKKRELLAVVYLVILVCLVGLSIIFFGVPYYFHLIQIVREFWGLS